MDLSLVVCTRNRADSLERCLQYIDSATGSFQLVVVDNNSTDATRSIVETFAAGSDRIRVTYVFEPQTGLAVARNTGWRAAEGDIIAFTDDDCYVDPSFTESVLQEFETNPDLGYIGGRILLFDQRDLRKTIKESTIEEIIPKGSFVPAGMIQGANFAISRVALEHVGGFDELMGAGTPYPAEDIDIITRLSAKGWDGKYSPKPVVFHHHGRRTKEDADQLDRGYAVGRGAYYAACVFNQASAWKAVKFWTRNAPRFRLIRFVRELRGAVGYSLTRILAAVTTK